MSDLTPAPLSDAELEPLLAQAIALAHANVAEDQLPFGAVAVLDGEVIATGVNTSRRDVDPTAHAETAAIRSALRATGRSELAGVTVVASAAPCPMCVAVAAFVGVDRLVYAAARSLAGEYGFTLAPAAAALGEAWDDPKRVHHVPHPAAEAPFRAYADRNGDSPS